MVGQRVDERGAEMRIREMCWGVSRGEPSGERSPSPRTSAIECHQKDDNYEILSIHSPLNILPSGITAFFKHLPHSHVSEGHEGNGTVGVDVVGRRELVRGDVTGTSVMTPVAPTFRGH
jgi:hypothetical protein